MGYVFTLAQAPVRWRLYSIIYYHIVHYGGRVYGHDGGYERDNLVSRVAWRLGNLSRSL